MDVQAGGDMNGQRTTCPGPRADSDALRRILDMACDAQMGYRMPVDVRNAIIGALELADEEASA